ncbi:MAG: hypothetical protein A3H63_02295 [Candidatus Harrisonbacteria bacterium RIFCSPLOWO2_02_FULL_45_10c]|uniref:Methyltransferase domain-containing protein n=1 Tax=Candidatus Harrisonbacteria bacterium RIFCSPLOWO2_02_FULL_45_10c TaxID=1798410 RepID=A0A1G1ZUB0_9BACT|nr:MAG: hypothetical protein A3H63_02295 [Candidatus Harrisonbacteria bacterium RIFCSPLOWO2_02_FULL_45_10c]
MIFQSFKQNPEAYSTHPFLKDSFKFVYQMLADIKPRSILDIGCASGDFLNFLPLKIQGVGIDASPALIREAKARVLKSNIRFIKGSILDKKIFSKFKEKFDVVTIMGTLHTFLDFQPVLDAALKLASKAVIIHSPFNDAPIDVRHFHKIFGEDAYQCAYSVFSKKSISNYLRKKRVGNFRFIPFEMKTELKRNVADPMRVYHVTVTNGERYLTNGMGILFKEYILKIFL